ncbi:hypothetical protein [Miniphocaeibacter massiliensis]|uniref:hypothetical protein n=1 Tax=Miniphocaeibacter massiliensis TaxID=2041841 RepID=UPI000C1C37DE|nr:hypothetical protein [Miniphocaeibacter massiliensis]
MKKFFITIGVLVLALSIFGIYDTSQKKKEAEAIAAKTSNIIATIENIEESDGKNKITIVATDENEDKFKGKKYVFTEGKVEKLSVNNEKNEEAKLKDLEKGKKIYIQHIGDIKDGDINEFTGEIVITIIPEEQMSTEPTGATEATETEPTKETKAE